jgi:hypothetical protein
MHTVEGKSAKPKLKITINPDVNSVSPPQASQGRGIENNSQEERSDTIVDDGTTAKLEDVLPLLILIDEISPTESVIRKLRNFLLAAAISPSVHNVIGIMTDAVRCITWESLFPYVEDLFRDTNYATLIRSTAMFTFCQVQLHKQLDMPNITQKEIEQCYRTGDVAKKDWLQAMFQLMTTYQDSLMEHSFIAFSFGSYLDQLQNALQDATKIVPERERVQLYTMLRPDYYPGEDLFTGASKPHVQDATYQGEVEDGPDAGSYGT